MTERTYASCFLIWVDTLDYHEIQAFSWRLLREYLFQLLTFRLSNSYDVNMAKNCFNSWMTNHPNAQTYLSSPSLAPHWKHGLRKTRRSCDGHVSFILDPDWFWEVTTIRFEIIISQASHVFSDEIFQSFLLINRYFSFLRYSYVLSIWKLTCYGMLFTSVWLKRYSLKRCSWFVISIRQKLLVSQNARKCATIQLHKVTSSKTKDLKCVLKSFKEKAKRKRIMNNISSEAPSFLELWVSNFIPGCDRFPAIFPGRDPREYFPRAQWRFE